MSQRLSGPALALILISVGPAAFAWGSSSPRHHGSGSPRHHHGSGTPRNQGTDTPSNQETGSPQG
ncbi:MAG: hypothetical protein ABSH53_11020 [Holophaga sp.]|jgi:hypothetical protein